MNFKVLVSPYRDVYTNLALEEHLFSHGEEVLFLWVNDPCVVLGYHQNTYKEVNLPYTKDHGIKVARRITGGGAVYHDEGNLNVSIVLKEDHSTLLNEILKEALKKLGLDAVLTSNNDLLLDGKKFSGQASYGENHASLYHSCILVDADLTALTKVLTPSKLKLKSHAVDSVRARVMNLSSILPSLTVEGLKEAIQTLDGFEPYEEKIPEIEIENRKKKFESKDFIFGKNPPFDYEFDRVVEGDVVNVRLTVKDGLIQDCAWYSDGGRDPKYAERFEKLKGRPLEDIDSILS